MPNQIITPSSKIVTIKTKITHKSKHNVGIGPLMFDQEYKMNTDINKMEWQPFVDSHNDVLTEDFLFRATLKFMEKPGSERYLLDYHTGDPMGWIPYALPWTVDIAKANNYDLTQVIDPSITPKSGFYIGFQPYDPDEFFANPDQQLSVGFQSGPTITREITVYD